MDAVERIAWRQVLQELRDLEAEYERAVREKADHCASKHAETETKPLIDIK